MIDFKEPLRTAYYQLLNGNLTWLAANVPVSDSVEKLADKDNTYVLLTQQNGFSVNDQGAFRSEETMLIDIVSRGTRVSKSTVDNIAGQIFALLFPSVQGNALPAQPGLSVINMRITDDRYLVFQTTGAVNVKRRLITITHLCSQGSGIGNGIPVFDIPNPVTSPDFTNSTTYNNPALKYINYFLFLNDASTYLLEGTDYVKVAGGGFTILFTPFDATTNFYTFYIIQQ
jgi:hypothetical protein